MDDEQYFDILTILLFFQITLGALKVVGFLKSSWAIVFIPSVLLLLGVIFWIIRYKKRRR